MGFDQNRRDPCEPFDLRSTVEIGRASFFFLGRTENRAGTAAELVGSWRFGRSGVLRRRGFGPGARGRRGEAFASVNSTGGGSG